MLRKWLIIIISLWCIKRSMSTDGKNTFWANGTSDKRKLLLVDRGRKTRFWFEKLSMRFLVPYSYTFVNLIFYRYLFYHFNKTGNVRWPAANGQTIKLELFSDDEWLSITKSNKKDYEILLEVTACDDPNLQFHF